MLCRRWIWLAGAFVWNDGAIAERPQPRPAWHRQRLIDDDPAVLLLAGKVAEQPMRGGARCPDHQP
jgi:hypothetical protein